MATRIGISATGRKRVGLGLAVRFGQRGKKIEDGAIDGDDGRTVRVFKGASLRHSASEHCARRESAAGRHQF
jgi:hypothetical protein